VKQPLLKPLGIHRRRHPGESGRATYRLLETCDVIESVTEHLARRAAFLRRRARRGSAVDALVKATLTPMYIECKSMYMSVRHKHLKIDQRKLDRAKHILRLPTEQATIDRALDAILAEDTILRAHKKARAVGGLVDAFGRTK